jgi:hypothetical protein
MSSEEERGTLLSGLSGRLQEREEYDEDDDEDDDEEAPIECFK